MALEVIGAIASIAQLAGTVYTISKTLYEVGEALSNAPSDIKDLARDLETFSDELHLLSTLLHGKDGRYADQVYRLTAKVIGDCATICTKIDRIIRKLQSGSVWAKVRWLYKEKEIMKLLARLRDLKLSLMGILSVLSALRADHMMDSLGIPNSSLIVGQSGHSLSAETRKQVEDTRLKLAGIKMTDTTHNYQGSTAMSTSSTSLHSGGSSSALSPSATSATLTGSPVSQTPSAASFASSTFISMVTIPKSMPMLNPKAVESVDSFHSAVSYQSPASSSQAMQAGVTSTTPFEASKNKVTAISSHHDATATSPKSTPQLDPFPKVDGESLKIWRDEMSILAMKHFSMNKTDAEDWVMLLPIPNNLSLSSTTTQSRYPAQNPQTESSFRLQELATSVYDGPRQTLRIPRKSSAEPHTLNALNLSMELPTSIIPCDIAVTGGLVPSTLDSSVEENREDEAKTPTSPTENPADFQTAMKSFRQRVANTGIHRSRKGEPIFKPIRGIHESGGDSEAKPFPLPPANMKPQPKNFSGKLPPRPPVISRYETQRGFASPSSQSPTSPRYSPVESEHYNLLQDQADTLTPLGSSRHRGALSDSDSSPYPDNPPTPYCLAGDFLSPFVNELRTPDPLSILSTKDITGTMAPAQNSFGGNQPAVSADSPFLEPDIQQSQQVQVQHQVSQQRHPSSEQSQNRHLLFGPEDYSFKSNRKMNGNGYYHDLEAESLTLARDDSDSDNHMARNSSSGISGDGTKTDPGDMEVDVATSTAPPANSSSDSDVSALLSQNKGSNKGLGALWLQGLQNFLALSSMLGGHLQECLIREHVVTITEAGPDSLVTNPDWSESSHKENINAKRETIPNAASSIQRIFEVLDVMEKTIGLEVGVIAWACLLCGVENLLSPDIHLALEARVEIIAQLAELASIIARYTVMENIYAQWEGMSVHKQYEETLISFSTHVLNYFGELLSPTVEYGDGFSMKMKHHFQDIMYADKACRAFTATFSTESPLKPERSVDDISDDSDDTHDSDGTAIGSEEAYGVQDMPSSAKRIRI
ncbi:hypothetical protein DSL72_005966 [Monilinia vaccinii-corymbosi]|uniref:Fungal N-terminal domain-containing protein n=1 Tax=Monilinia vaccinii-corymbosi TaxID=61207 RepID=A0A8A3PH72_9HELO|nr:hypothetical protein DSL72_005966 [Monilinia vaccinii-corymbosi]